MKNVVARLVQLLLCACAIVCIPVAVAQQNDDGAEYDLSAKTEVRGQAVRIWTKPPFIVVSATDQDGQTKTWRIDIGDGQSADRLLGTLKLGDALVVTGNPSTAPSDRLRATSILRPSDDLVWQR